MELLKEIEATAMLQMSVKKNVGQNLKTVAMI